MQMNLNGYLKNCAHERDALLRKLDEMLDELMTTREKEEAAEDLAALREMVNQLHGNTQFLVETVQFNMPRWDAAEEQAARYKELLANTFNPLTDKLPLTGKYRFHRGGQGFADRFQVPNGAIVSGATLVCMLNLKIKD